MNMFLWHSRKKKTPPKPDEFWLSQDNFRDYESMPGFVGYYGVPSFFYRENVLEQTKNEENFIGLHAVQLSACSREVLP